MASIRATRDRWPKDPEWLHGYIRTYYGIDVSWRKVCRNHTPPFAALYQQVHSRPRPDTSVWHASRGSGKSFLSALDTHLISRFNANHGTRVLGGSLDQSRQIYDALKKLTDFRGHAAFGNDAASIRRLLARSARYVNGSVVEILACSPKSVRGPHVPSLKLDEVDEMLPDLRESAMGMVMQGGSDATALGSSALLTSTWHKPNGPMAALMDQAASGVIPSHTWCVFDVLERCPESRSGPWVGGADGYLNCPRCPIREFCHAERTPAHPRPKAKLSSGHFRIADLVAAVKRVGFYTFKSDYLCEGPKTEGLWFPTFSAAENVTEDAEFDPRYEVWASIDSGVRAGAVFLQFVPVSDGEIEWEEVRVFADYFAEGREAGLQGRDVLGIVAERSNGRRDRTITDPSGASRTSIGPTVIEEWNKVGLNRLEHWPKYKNSVADGLALLDSFVRSGDGTTALKVHPRCRHLINAMRSYERKRIAGVWLEEPRDEQHPSEDLVDPLRGALQVRYPEGKRPERVYRRLPARKVI